MYTIRTVKILIKLLPSILALRKDRKKWINQNKNKIDPRINPLGHLVYDAPEILIGLACGIFSGLHTARKFSNKNSKKIFLANILASSLMSGYLGYTVTKKIKKYLE